MAMLSREAFVLVGPTASGKTEVVQRLAARRHAAVLSADSMLVYMGMDVGTAKPSRASRGTVPYLGIDLVKPDQPFDVWQYLQCVRAQVDTLPSGMPILVVGGSGLYVKALLEGLDTGAAPPNRRAHWMDVFRKQGIAGLQLRLQQLDADGLRQLADPHNPRRLIRAIEQASRPGGQRMRRSWHRAFTQVPVAGLMPAPALLRNRIRDRIAVMYAQGLAEEARALLQRYPMLSDTARQAIGYNEALDFIAGRCTLADAQSRTMLRTNRLAKRQRTWFRHQAEVAWLFPDAKHDIEHLASQVEEIWSKHGSVQLKL